tara:strand:- start:2 stop:499 length:498 start_codon:yes stop_codon:yes gene_type:complete
MAETIKDFFTIEIIYQFVNIGVVPFWLMLIFLPASKFTNLLVNNLFMPTVLALTYGYIVYQQIYPLGLDENIDFDIVLRNFNLYLGLSQLMELMDNELFVLIFWIHFLSLSLFLGQWISRDALKYNVHKFIVFFPLILTYFTGPIGLCFYLILRLLIVQKFKLHE